METLQLQAKVFITEPDQIHHTKGKMLFLTCIILYARLSKHILRRIFDNLRVDENISGIQNLRRHRTRLRLFAESISGKEIVAKFSLLLWLFHE